MLFVEDLKEFYSQYNLPYEFVECLPAECPSCGALTEIRPSLTGLQCSNPRCPDKVLKRIEAICKELGVLNFGESTIAKYIEYHQVTNPLVIFSLKPGMELSPDISEVISEKILSQLVGKNEFQLWEFVKIANLPYIQTSSKELLEGYESLEDAYLSIERGGVSLIQQKLGIANNGEVSVRASKIYSTLMEFKDDLFEGLKYVKIVKPSSLLELNVVCSDQVGGGFATKKEFYGYIKDTFGDKVTVNFLSSVKKSIDYLVWAGADGTPARYTSKVKTVEGYNERGSSIPIVTAKQFINCMKVL